MIAFEQNSKEGDAVHALLKIFERHAMDMNI